MAKDRQCSGFVRVKGTYSGKGGGAPTPSFTSYGKPFYYEAANWTAGTAFYWEVFMRRVVGTAYSRLLDITSGSSVADSQVSTTNLDFQRIRSSAVTLTDAHEYMGQLGKVSGDSGEGAGGEIIGVPP